MKEKTGRVYSVAEENAPVPGYTISREISDGERYIGYFSLAEDTDISAEIYTYHKLLIVAEGRLEVYFGGKTLSCGALECVITPTGTPVGVRTASGAVYTEIMIRRNDSMNKMIKPGEVFKLADLVPYQEGKIVNMDVIHNSTMKFVIMAFDAGTGLSEHAAPAEAMIFALDGEGIIGYEGEEHIIKAGENFCFARGGRHSVKANGRFKMALLLVAN